MAGPTRNLARAQRNRTKPAHRQTPHGRGAGPHQDRRAATAPRKNQKTAARGRYAPGRNPNARRMDGAMAQHHRAQRQTPHPRNLPIRLQHHPQRHRRNATRQNNPRHHRRNVRQTRQGTPKQNRPQPLSQTQAGARRSGPRTPHPIEPGARRNAAALRVAGHPDPRTPDSRPGQRRPHSTPSVANTATWQIPTTTAKCGASCGTSCSRPA